MCLCLSLSLISVAFLVCIYKLSLKFLWSALSKSLSHTHTFRTPARILVDNIDSRFNRLISLGGRHTNFGKKVNNYKHATTDCITFAIDFFLGVNGRKTYVYNGLLRCYAFNVVSHTFTWFILLFYLNVPVKRETKIMIIFIS